jgi:hypothetical protein
MARDNDTSSYTITYYQGNASSTTNLPSAQTINYITASYTPDG